VRVPAKAEYAIRALCELAAGGGERLVSAEEIADAQGISTYFLLGILADLRAAGLVESRRGREGGYRLARPAEEIPLAEVMRVVSGPLASVQGQLPQDVTYPPGPAEALREVWVAVRASLRAVLETVTVSDVVGGTLPTPVQELVADPDAWTARVYLGRDAPAP
jgi:Rrf2 family protein